MASSRSFPIILGPGMDFEKLGLREEPLLLIQNFSSVQFSRSVMSDSWQLHDRSTPGLPVHHQLPESTQTHVHCVSDAI